MNKYAIIDDSGYVVGSARSSNLITDNNYITVSSFSETDNKMRDTTNNVWIADDRTWPTVIRQLSKIDFVELFTDAEMEALIDFAKTNTKAALFLRKLDSYQEINLNNTRLQTAITAMETVGVIGTGRASEIIDSTSDVITTIQPPRQ